MRSLKEIAEDNPKVYLKRLCMRCHELFRPRSRYSRLCDKCTAKNLRKAWRNKVYEKEKLV